MLSDRILQAQIWEHYGAVPAGKPYTLDTDPEMVLPGAAPWDEMYLRWLEAMIHYHNSDDDRYNNSITLFNNAYEADGKAICGTRGWYYDKEGDHDIKVINREIGRLRLSYNEAAKLNKPIVAFLHYPPVYGDIECKEIMDALTELGITECYYGHLHGERTHKNAVTGMYKGINFHLIACDYTRFVPVSVR